MKAHAPDPLLASGLRSPDVCPHLRQDVLEAALGLAVRPPFPIALLTELLDHAYQTANNSPGRKLPTPLLVCLDELGNAVPLLNLAEIASTAASHNIQLISIFHDIAQARERYRQQALTAINNHRARMLLPGVADIETLRYFSDLLGDEEVKDRADPHAPLRRRPLAPADQLRQIKHQHALLIYDSLKPVTPEKGEDTARPRPVS